MPAAAAAGGNGPDDALQPSDDWQPLEPGDSVWYAFDYAGDGCRIEVRLATEPAESATFALWTPEEIRRWGLGLEAEPLGRGSVDPHATGTVSWQGSFTTAGTYYVVVEQDSGYAGTSHYQLEVSGGGVSWSEPAPVPAPEPVTVQAETEVPGEPTGTLVFQTTYGGTFYTINVDGTQLQPVTNGIDPVWSPNGEQIAFVRWEEPRGVWIVDVETGAEWRVFDWSETRYPSWSPDGTEIVFAKTPPLERGGGRLAATPDSGESDTATASLASPAAGPPQGGGGNQGGGTVWQLGIVTTADSEFREPLPNSDISLMPAWSPDGDQIVYSADHGLRIQSVDGQESWQLTADPDDTSPVWSPDSSKVAFVHQQHDHWEIWVVDVTTGQQMRLTDTPEVNGVPANSVSPAWSPDGNYIAYLTDQSGKWEIWIMESDGSNAGPLFDNELDGLTLDYVFAGERAISWTW